MKQVPIAICGMGMRLPGGIRNDADLYDFLINKKDARKPTPNDKYNVDAYYSKHAKHGTIITKHGNFLEEVDFAKFDTTMFNMTPAEVEQLDPSQRLVLEVVREAFETAGEVDWRGKKIGSYVGVFSEDWQDLHAKDTSDYGPYQVIGVLDFALGNRISYEYDLKGPRYVFGLLHLVAYSNYAANDCQHDHQDSVLFCRCMLASGSSGHPARRNLLCSRHRRQPDHGSWNDHWDERSVDTFPRRLVQIFRRIS